MHSLALSIILPYSKSGNSQITMIWEEIGDTIQFLGSLLMDSRLQVKLASKRTKFKVKFSVIVTDLIPSTLDKNPSTIQTMWFSNFGL